MNENETILISFCCEQLRFPVTYFQFSVPLLINNNFSVEYLCKFDKDLFFTDCIDECMNFVP